MRKNKTNVRNQIISFIGYHWIRLLNLAVGMEEIHRTKNAFEKLQVPTENLEVLIIQLLVFVVMRSFWIFYFLDKIEKLDVAKAKKIDARFFICDLVRLSLLGISFFINQFPISHDASRFIFGIIFTFILILSVVEGWILVELEKLQKKPQKNNNRQKTNRRQIKTPEN